jgi:hypothetical protein
MSLLKNIVFLILLFCFSACKTPAFVEKKIVVFDTGFPVFNFASYGTWYDKKDKKEYIYFANPDMGGAIVRFFSSDGHRQSKIEDIPLKNGLKGLTDISSIFVYDIDTVVIVNSSSYYISQMVYLNRKGERIQKMNLVDSGVFETNGYRMLYCDNQTSHKPFVYLQCHWNWLHPADSSLLPSSFKSKLEHLKVYYKKHYETPSVCKWNIRTNTCTFTAANMIPTYFFPQGDTSFSAGMGTLVLSEMLDNCYANKLFIWMESSNKILVLNPDNLQIEHSFDVSSKYSPVGIPPFPLELQGQKTLKSTNGIIVKILYDKKRSLYYVITKHEIPEEDMAFSREAPLSVHIYNTKFKKLKEQYFEGGKYDYRFIFLTSQGLFIAQNENNKDYDPTKCKFYFFEIEQ